MDVIQEQLEAYNARDLERFVACYAEDVVAEDGAGNVTRTGRDDLRRHYGPMFQAHPDLHCRIANRIRVGNYVIDEELITGRGPEEIHAVAIYTVEGHQIAHVRFLR